MKNGSKRARSGTRRSPRQETQTILRHWHEAVPNDRLAHLVKDATRALLRALQLRLTESGVLLGHWTFLRILWEKDGITQRELSEQAGVMEPTTFSALKTMESLGYVTRRKLAGNKKKVFVFLTPYGRGLKAKLVPLAREVNEIAIRNVNSSDVAAARRTLLAIIERLAEDEASASRRIPSTREVGLAVSMSKGGKDLARRLRRDGPRVPQ
jgi:MarR family transcriptional regulator, organic hydroperoxide resistance regulator